MADAATGAGSMRYDRCVAFVIACAAPWGVSPAWSSDFRAQNACGDVTPHLEQVQAQIAPLAGLLDFKVTCHGEACVISVLFDDQEAYALEFSKMAPLMLCIGRDSFSYAVDDETSRDCIGTQKIISVYLVPNTYANYTAERGIIFNLTYVVTEDGSYHYCDDQSAPPDFGGQGLPNASILPNMISNRAELSRTVYGDR